MFMKEKKNKRFVIKDAQGMSFGAIEVMLDTKTGVNYIVLQSPYAGITPLLDENGNIVIDNIDIS